MSRRSSLGLAALLLLLGVVVWAQTPAKCPADARLDSLGRTPLMAAAMIGDADAARRAIAEGSDLEREWQDRAPLIWAVMYGHAAVVEQLLKAGADIDRRSTSGDFALQMAVWMDHIDMAREFLRRGAVVRDAPHDARLLHLAVEHDDVDLVQLVIDLKLPIDRADPEHSNYTPLHVACSHGNLRVALVLLDRGARIDARSAEGWTPLHLACGHGHPDTAGLLLGRGADLAALDQVGRTPVHLAAELGQASVLNMLEERVSWEKMWKLCAVADAHGRTPMHLAAWGGHQPCVSRIYLRDTVLVQTPSLHWTPAHLAALAGNIGLTLRLSAEGKDPPRDALGRTPQLLLHESLASIEGSEPGTPAPGKPLDLPAMDASNVPIVSWTHDMGFSSGVVSGPKLVVWSDGVFLRGHRGEGAESSVGQLPNGRAHLLLEELKETGLLDRPNVFSVSVDSPSDAVAVRIGDREARYEMDGFPPWFRSEGSALDNMLTATEWVRACTILEHVRADREDPVDLHLVEGRFRGITPQHR